MELVDHEIQQQVNKFQKLSSNGSAHNSSNPHKIATSRGNNLVLQNHVDDGGDPRFYGWPSSRIVRVSRASGGKDRHSKVLTSKGLRDRRVRLSVGTAIQFYDLQDRLGYDQPSKAVEWLLKAASSSIDELPDLDLPFSVTGSSDHHQKNTVSEKKVTAGSSNDLEDRIYMQQNSSNTNNNNNVSGGSCSSTSETSKGSGLSLSRSENRMKARERARLLVLRKEKVKETDSTQVITGLNQNHQVNPISQNSSFTDLLTGGINTTTTARSPIDCFFNRPPQIPQFNIMSNGDNQLQQFSLVQDSFQPTVTTTFGGGGGGRGGELQNFNFLATLSGGGAVAPGGFTRGTLQSNLQSSHQRLVQSSLTEGSTNLPFFIVPNATVDHFTATGGYPLVYSGGVDGVDHHKEKSKN